MSAIVFLSALLGLALQFAFVYWAIRLALRHERAFQAKQAVAIASEVGTVPQADVMLPAQQDIEQIRQHTRESRERAEARRIAEKPDS